MSRGKQRTLAAACLLTLAFLGGSLGLPAGFELARARDFPHPRSDLHGWIADRDRWPRWAPDWMLGPTAGDPNSALDPREPGARITATPGERGIWCDLPALGPRLAKCALMLDEREQGRTTRLRWVLRTDVGLDPWRRWSNLFARRRLAREMEQALERLGRALEQTNAGSTDAPFGS